MTENMKAFLDVVQNNEELKEKVSEIDKKAKGKAEEYLDDYIAVAKEYGITLTREDFLPEQPNTSEMTDEELQAVTGGDQFEYYSALFCAFGGDELDDKGCFCAIIGAVKGCGCVVVGASRASQTVVVE